MDTAIKPKSIHNLNTNDSIILKARTVGHLWNVATEHARAEETVVETTQSETG